MASGIITGGSLNGTASNRYEQKIEWSSSAYDSNSSTVTATLYTRCTSSWSGGAWNGYGDATWTITINGSSSSGTCSFDMRNTTAWVKWGSYSTRVSHNSDGTKSVGISASYDTNGPKGLTTGTLSNTVTLDTLSSNCTSAYNVQIPSIITPSNGLTVTWSPGNNGNNNPITGYDVYLWGTTSFEYPTTSKYDKKISVGAGVTSYTFSDNSFFSGCRGYIFSVGIITKSSRNNTSMAYSGSGVVNVLPPAPTMSVSSVIIPSTSNSTTFSGTIGVKSSNQGYSSSKIYYKNSKGDSGYMGSTITVWPDTWYFYTEDTGGERSEKYATVVVTQNEKPKINSFSYALGEKTIVYQEGSEEAVKGYYEGIILKVESSKTGKVTIKGDTDGGKYTLTEASITANVEKDLTLNLREYGFVPSKKINFYCIVNDTIEDSDLETLEMKDNVQISPPPKFYEYSNLVEKAKNTHFYNKLKFTYYYDSYYFNGSFSSNYADYFTEKIKSSDTEETKNRKMSWTVSLNPNYFKDGETYNFILTLSRERATSESIQLTRAPAVNFITTDSLERRINPLTDGSTDKTIKEISFKISSSELLSDYKISHDIGDNAVDLVIVKDSLESGSLKDLMIFKDQDVRDEYLDIILKISDNTFFNEISKNDIFYPKNPEGNINCYAKVTVTNLFGQKFSQLYPIILDYNEDILIENFKISGGRYKKSETEIEEFSFSSTDKKICEGISLKFSPTITTYNLNSFSYMLQIKRGDNDFVDYLNKRVTKTFEGTSIGFGSPALLKFDIITDEIKEITDEDSCKFRLLVQCGNQERIFDSDMTYDRIQFTPSAIELLNGDYSTVSNEGEEKGKYILEYNITNGFTNNSIPQETELLIKIGDEESKVWQSTTDDPREDVITWWGESKKQSYDTDKMGANYKEVSLITQTTHKVTYGSVTVPITKTYTSNKILVYSLSPTVAYRQNHLGINMTPVKNDSILEIAPHEGKQKIYFNSPFLTNPVCFNLAEGRIYNIIIDCGEIT